MSQNDWEHYVAERLAERLEIPTIKAKDRMYQNYALLMNEHNAGSTPNQAATALINR